MPVEWNDSYSTGDARIDSQHQKLFGYVNTLEKMIEAARGGQAPTHREVEDLLDFLEMYVNVHFAYEEVCMAIRRCPLAAQNREAHGKLINFYGEFRETVKGGATLSDLESLHTALANWLVNHICRIDVSLRDVPAEAPARGLRR